MIAILNPVDAQPISYRAIAPGDSLASGEISYSGTIPANPVWHASSSTVVPQSALFLAQIAQSALINAAFTAITTTGLTISGILASPIVLLADPVTEGIIVSRLANCKVQRDPGIVTSNTPIGSVMSTLTDAYGVQQAMSVMTFMSVAVSYINQLATLRQYRDGQLAAIASAGTVGDVQAITWTTPALPASVLISVAYNAFLASITTTYLTPGGDGSALTGITPDQVGAEPAIPDAAANSGTVFYSNGSQWLPVSLPLDSDGRLSMDSMPIEILLVLKALVDPKNDALVFLREVLKTALLTTELPPWTSQ